jgi:hypothetical protein
VTDALTAALAGVASRPDGPKRWRTKGAADAPDLALAQAVTVEQQPTRDRTTARAAPRAAPRTRSLHRGRCRLPGLDRNRTMDQSLRIPILQCVSEPDGERGPPSTRSPSPILRPESSAAPPPSSVPYPIMTRHRCATVSDGKPTIPSEAPSTCRSENRTHRRILRGREHRRIGRKCGRRRGTHLGYAALQWGLPLFRTR